jgi:hypothetical protein
MNDDGLVEHTPTETPEEVKAYWTPERMAGCRPVPMPNRVKFPTVEVTEDEFIRLVMEDNGGNLEKAQQTLRFSKALGSEVLAGDKMLRLKNENL